MKIRILIIIITVLDTYFLRELCEAERVQVIPIQYLHMTGRGVVLGRYVGTIDSCESSGGCTVPERV
jgi:hypothetical protein